MEVAFKRRTKAAREGRKRSRRAADEPADEEEAGADTLRVIEEVLEDQRLRAQALRQEAAARASERRPEAQRTAPAAEFGLHDPKRDGAAGQKLLQLLDGQFTGQSAGSQRDQHEELLEKYIEEKLKKKRSGEGGQAEAPRRSEEDALFEVPDHLNPKLQGGEKAADEDASGGVLIWNTGIAEVELPVSFAHQTAAATERALKREAESRSAKSKLGVDSSALPTNFSADFDRHRSEFVAELKSMNKDDQRERGFRKVGKHQASDDAAVSRFRKFESRRKHR